MKIKLLIFLGIFFVIHDNFASSILDTAYSNEKMIMPQQLAEQSQIIDEKDGEIVVVVNIKETKQRVQELIQQPQRIQENQNIIPVLQPSILPLVHRYISRDVDAIIQRRILQQDQEDMERLFQIAVRQMQIAARQMQIAARQMQIAEQQLLTFSSLPVDQEEDAPINQPTSVDTLNKSCEVDAVIERRILQQDQEEMERPFQIEARQMQIAEQQLPIFSNLRVKWAAASPERVSLFEMVD